MFCFFFEGLFAKEVGFMGGEVFEVGDVLLFDSVLDGEDLGEFGIGG